MSKFFAADCFCTKKTHQYGAVCIKYKISWKNGEHQTARRDQGDGDAVHEADVLAEKYQGDEDGKDDAEFIDGRDLCDVESAPAMPLSATKRSAFLSAKTVGRSAACPSASTTPTRKTDMMTERTAVAALVSSPATPTLPKMETNAAHSAESSA